MSRADREIWKGDISSVVGLQKRGLRGLMEGRRLRERGGRPAAADEGSVNAGVAPVLATGGNNNSSGPGASSSPVSGAPVGTQLGLAIS